MHRFTHVLARRIRFAKNGEEELARESYSTETSAKLKETGVEKKRCFFPIYLFIFLLYIV